MLDIILYYTINSEDDETNTPILFAELYDPNPTISLWEEKLSHSNDEKSSHTDRYRDSSIPKNSNFLISSVIFSFRLNYGISSSYGANELGLIGT